MKLNEVKWLIETDRFNEKWDEVIKEIKSQGFQVKTCKYKPFIEEQDLPYTTTIPHCVVTLGSINLIRYLQQKSTWIPGTFANFSNLDCATYYPYYGEYLFNDKYIFLPFGEIKRRFSELQELLGTNALFIRPSSGLKQFGGTVVYDPKDLGFLEEIRNDLLCVIAPKKDLSYEFRFFCTKDRVLSGAMYYDENNQLNPKGVEVFSKENNHSFRYYIESIRYVSKILEKVNWKPDKIFTMDIGWDSKFHNPRLLELNSFSCSGWYGHSPKEIVREIAELALAEWNEYYDC